MKRLLPLLALPLLALAGCSSNSSSGTTETANSAAPAPAGSTTPAGKKIKVALLTTGDINDQGWNQLAYEGLQKLEANGDTVAHQVTKAASDRQPAIRDFADQGNDLLLLHGYEYGNDALAIAPKYPKVHFVVVAGNVKQAPNVATLVPKLEDATYLLGMAAGAVTKTGKIGLIGGMSIPVIASTFDAFTLGVKASNPKAVVLEPKYVGDFEDQVKGKELANSLIAAGADVLFQNADQAGKGMFAAAQDATKAGNPVYVFGSNRDQNSVAPELTLGSAVIDMPKAFEDIAASVADNTFKPEFVELNLKNGAIAVVWNDALKAKIPADALKKIDAAAAQIKAGTLKLQRKA